MKACAFWKLTWKWRRADTSASELKQRRGFGRCGRAPAILGTRLASDPHELGVAASEAILAEANIVLETRAHSIAIPLQRPTHDFRLMTSDPGRRPGRVGENALELAMQKVEDVPFCRECIPYSHHELNVRVIIDQSEVYELARAINMRKVEYFDLRQTPCSFIRAARPSTKLAEFS